MTKSHTVIIILMLGSFLSACTDGAKTPKAGNGTDNGVTAAVVGSASNGKTFYKTHCMACHAAGRDDRTKAFGASDLATLVDLDKIKSDMSTRGGIGIQQFKNIVPLMGRFGHIENKRVEDLKAYIKSL